jgi:SWI/SNF-related matrix-associated actin-dependent regulator of chromatin subfamily A member 5
LHKADVKRFEEESYAADMAALEQVEKKRNEAATTVVDDGATRGARAQIEQERQIREDRRQKKLKAMAEDDSEKAQLRRELAAQKKAEIQERRDKRDEEQKILAKQHKKLDKEEAKKAAARLDYLLKQSSIFAKLQGGKGSLPGANDKDDVKQESAASDKKKGGVHHRTDTAAVKDEEEEIDEEQETVRHVFLTKQPSSIKFGQLKPYQLESLNWMIHLAEKGLNGILADGLWFSSLLLILLLYLNQSFLNILHFCNYSTSVVKEMGLGKLLQLK